MLVVVGLGMLAIIGCDAGSEAAIETDQAELEEQLENAQSSGDSWAAAEISARLLDQQPDNIAFKTARCDALQRIGESKALEIEIASTPERLLAHPDFLAIQARHAESANSDLGTAGEFWVKVAEDKEADIDLRSEAYEWLARRASQTFDWKTSEKWATGWLDYANGGVDARLTRLAARLWQRRPKDARADLEVLRAADPTFVGVRTWTPKIERVERVQPELEALDAEISRDSTNIMARFDRAALCVVFALPELAWRDVKQLRTLAPESSGIQVLHGLTARALGEPLPEELRDVVNQGRLWTASKQRYVTQMKAWDGTLRALVEIEADAAFRDTVPGMLDRVSYLRTLDQGRLAMPIGREALRASGGSDEGYHAALLAHLAAHDIRSGIILGEESVQQHPKVVALWGTLAELKAADGDYEGAVETMDKAISINKVASYVALRSKWRAAIKKRNNSR